MKTVIVNGVVVDGSGGEPFAADILIGGGIITAVGKLPESARENAKVVDAAGRYVTPGFVDIHRHCDRAALRGGFGDIELSQGITTAVSGSCGLTPFPYAPSLSAVLVPVLGEADLSEPQSFAGYTEALRQTPLPLNIGALIGSCAIRAAVKGDSPSPFSPAETNAAEKIAEDAMEHGALGISVGVMYVPEFFSSAGEMARTAAAAAKRGGVLTAHIRGEGDSLVASVEEAVLVARLADIPLEISHFKCCGQENWGRGIYQAIEVIEKARQTQDVTVDAYPYSGGATTLQSLLPADFPREKWNDPSALEAALTRKYDGWDNYALSLGFERILMRGRPLSESGDPFRLLSETLVEEQGRAGVTVMSMSPEDVDAVIRLSYANIISDALYPPDTSLAHPRLFSAFPKILRDFVRERGALTLPEAVRKMSALPAARLSLSGRGLIKPGYAADINIFSLENIMDRSDFSRGGLLAAGMDTVFVNGETAWQNGKRAGNGGKFLARNASF